MSGLTFAASCPVDGGRLSIVTASAPTTYRTSAVCRCDTCQSEMHVIVGMDIIRDTRYHKGYGAI